MAGISTDLISQQLVSVENLNLPRMRLRSKCKIVFHRENPPEIEEKCCANAKNGLDKLSSSYTLPPTSNIGRSESIQKQNYKAQGNKALNVLKGGRISPIPALKISQHKRKKCHMPQKENLVLKYMLNTPILSMFKQLSRPEIAPSPHITTSTSTAKIRRKFRLFPSLGATSFLTIITLMCLEIILLSTVSNCAKTFYMHWNTSNSIFRIDNTDHIIDVNKGNLAFEFDQVHIICPVYEPGTYENETEKYIIYNVSKVEYETCRITNADPRVIAICDKPQKLMFFTITFRPFTPQPGGLEFLPGNDYYFISTSSKDDLYRRIGGRCSTNNMKVVFKVCCAPDEKNKTTTASTTSVAEPGSSSVDADVPLVDSHPSTKTQQHNNINTFGGGININSANVHNSNNGIQLKPLNVGGSGTSINTNIDQFNRIPMQSNGISVIGHTIGGGPLGVNNGILLTPGGGHGGINMIPPGGSSGLGQYHPGIGQYHPGQTTTGIRINNVPSQQNYPSHKHNINNNNGKDVEEQEIGRGDGGVGGVDGGGMGVDIGNRLPPQFLPPIIDTNHSNIVQSTMNWPPTHWSGNSNNYYNHNTNLNIPNQNISANDHHYHSSPHRPTSTTSTTNHNKKNKNDHYDKHPNEVVKNEELTYNSASSTIHRHYWSWEAITIWSSLESTLAAGGSSLEQYLRQFIFVNSRFITKLENFLLQLMLHPLVFLTILFVTVVQYIFLKLILICNVKTSYSSFKKQEMHCKNEKSSKKYEQSR